MRGRLIFMTEEASMVETLQVVIPKVVPNALEKEHWLAIPHEGKNDLQKSFPRKLESWREPGVRFMVLRDTDGAPDCKLIKQRLINLIPTTFGGSAPIIRLVCQELAAWFLGDLDAIKAAYPGAEKHSRFKSIGERDPDTLTNASELLAAMTGTRAKRTRARKIAQKMDPSRNRSTSFGHFCCSTRRLLSGLQD